MLGRVAQRTVYYLSLWLGIILFSFLLFHVVPVDPVRTMLGPNAEQAQVDKLREELGLERPLAEQFLEYLGNAARLRFGISYLDRRPVTAEVQERLGVTLALVSASLLITIAYLGVVIGLEARGRGSIAAFMDFSWSSMPSMFSAVVVALLAARYYPFGSFSGGLGSVDGWFALLPPSLVLAFYPMAVLSRILRRQIGQIREQEYVRAARARGLSEAAIFGKHILRNAAIPCAAAFSNLLPALFTNTFVVEIVFSIPGIGSLLVRSLFQRDFPVLEGIVIVTALAIVLIYLAVELLYPLLDPRVRASSA